MDLRFLLNDDSVNELENECHPVDANATKLRAGKWTEEEELFAAALIKHFIAGALSIPPGTSLRCMLATTLRCSLVRVSDKLTVGTLGASAIPRKLGQQRYFPSMSLSAAERAQVAQELLELEEAFLRRERMATGADLKVESITAMVLSPQAEVTDDEPSRVGSWSREEQVYTRALIDAFLDGRVDIPEGTSLRSFLSDRLSCSPMRVSKKLARGKIAGTVIPKRLGTAIYERRSSTHPVDISRTERELEQLRNNCFSSAEVPCERKLSPEYSSLRRYEPSSPYTVFHRRAVQAIGNDLVNMDDSSLEWTSATPLHCEPFAHRALATSRYSQHSPGR